MIDKVKPQTITMQEGVSLTYIVSDESSFVSSDVSGVLKRQGIEANVIEIILLKSTVKGEGRKLLNAFCEEHSTFAIVLKAEPTYNTEDAYEAACVSGEHTKSLNKLKQYYASNGFVNINDLTCYYGACAFLYENEIGEKVLQAINNKH